MQLAEEPNLYPSIKDTQPPTMAALWAELDIINAEDPIEFELSQRIDRPNPILDMPDDFFV